MRFPCDCGSGKFSWTLDTDNGGMIRVCMSCFFHQLPFQIPHIEEIPFTDPDYGRDIPVLDLD